MDRREIWKEIVDWIHLAQEGDQWRALVDTVMKGGELVNIGVQMCVCV
jgi:hypothetical protein